MEVESTTTIEEIGNDEQSVQLTYAILQLHDFLEVHGKKLEPEDTNIRKILRLIEK